MGPVHRWGLVLGAIFASAAVSLPAHAQAEEIVIAPDKDWQHAWTAMTFPSRIDAYERRELTQFEDRETNMGARYFAANTGTMLSIYIYRPGQPEPSIWHDRAITALLYNTRMGPFDLDTLKVSTFVPSGGSAPSGIRSVLEGAGDYRSTGTALYRAGDWLIKLRISSSRLPVEALDHELARILDGLPALEMISPTPAYSVAPCGSAPSFSNAGRMEEDGDSRMVAAVSEGLTGDGMLADVIQEVRNGEKIAPELRNFCSIGEKTDHYAIYLPSDSDDRYVMALGDAGFGISVQPANMLDLVRKANGESVGFYRVTTASGLEVQTFLPFTSMPTPDQAAQAAFNESPIIATTRPLPGDKGSESKIFVGEPDESAQSIE